MLRIARQVLRHEIYEQVILFNHIPIPFLVERREQSQFRVGRLAGIVLMVVAQNVPARAQAAFARLDLSFLVAERTATGLLRQPGCYGNVVSAQSPAIPGARTVNVKSEDICGN